MTALAFLALALMFLGLAVVLHAALAASTAADTMCDLEPDEALPGENGVH